MRVGKKDVRITLDKARKLYPTLDIAEKDAKLWFERTEYHATQKNKKSTLWCLCVASCALFKSEINRKRDRVDIVDQIQHQMMAYGV